MSLLVKPARAQLLVDPITQVSERGAYLVERGGASYLAQGLQATSYSDSQFTWTVFPSSRQTFIDRKMKVKVQCDFTITAGASGVPLINDFDQGLSSLRSMPLSHAITNGILGIGNNQSFTFNVAQNISALAHSNAFPDDLFGEQSTYPALADQLYSYSLVGSRNPMNVYNDSEYFLDGRGAYAYTQISGGSSDTSIVVRYTWSEPLFLPMLISGGSEQEGIIGVDQLTLNLQLGNLYNMLSHSLSGSRPYTNVSAHFTASPQLLWMQVTPDVIEPIPRVITYSYVNPQPYPTSIGSSAGAGATGLQVTSNNIQLNGIPSKMMVWIRRSDASLADPANGPSYTDSFMNISAMQVQLGTRSGLLGTYTEEQLYDMSHRNGLAMSWPQWHSYLGSVAIVSFPFDLGLGPSEAPGVNNFTSNLSVQVTYNNLDPNNAIPVQMQIVLFYDGSCTIVDGNVTTQQAVLTPADVVNAKDLPRLVKPHRPMFGGSIFDSIKSAIGFLRDKKLISTIAKAIPHPISQKVGEVAESLGFGDGEGKRRHAAGAYVAGKRLTKAQLRM
jgi:hypothetical protein